ncbi:MAG TPA: IS630 family transposase [Solirubrobacteraceae bacterium]
MGPRPALTADQGRTCGHDDPRLQAPRHDDSVRRVGCSHRAALDVLTGAVIGECLPRHRHTEFLKFLRTIDREFPKGLQVHLILDNYSTHKHENVKKWLAKHPRFYLHFTPTSSSWLNMIERWFGKLTDKAIRRGIFHSVPELITAIETYLQANNQNPEPFTWTATAESILEKVRRGRATPQTITT